MKRIGCFLILTLCSGLYSMERNRALEHLKRELAAYDEAVDAIQAEAVQSLIDQGFGASAAQPAGLAMIAAPEEPAQESKLGWVLKRVVAPFAIAGGATVAIIMLINSIKK